MKDTGDCEMDDTTDVPVLIEWKYYPVWKMSIPNLSDGAKNVMRRVELQVQRESLLCGKSKCSGHGVCPPNVKHSAGTTIRSMINWHGTCICIDGFRGRTCEIAEDMVMMPDVDGRKTERVGGIDTAICDEDLNSLSNPNYTNNYTPCYPRAASRVYFRAIRTAYRGCPQNQFIIQDTLTGIAFTERRVPTMCGEYEGYETTTCRLCYPKRSIEPSMYWAKGNEVYTGRSRCCIIQPKVGDMIPLYDAKIRMLK